MTSNDPPVPPVAVIVDCVYPVPGLVTSTSTIAPPEPYVTLYCNPVPSPITLNCASVAAFDTVLTPAAPLLYPPP